MTFFKKIISNSDLFLCLSVKCFLILNKMILFIVNTRETSISSSGGEIVLFSETSHSSSRAQPASYSMRNRDSFPRGKAVRV